ncbi:MAG TPA: hypothetical protein VIM77_10350 [Mucilaginibacter sp.]
MTETGVGSQPARAIERRCLGKRPRSQTKFTNPTYCNMTNRLPIKRIYSILSKTTMRIYVLVYTSTIGKNKIPLYAHIEQDAACSLIAAAIDNGVISANLEYFNGSVYIDGFSEEI